MSFDLADSAMMICYHCGEPVCTLCQIKPVSDILSFCDSCDSF